MRLGLTMLMSMVFIPFLVSGILLFDFSSWGDTEDWRIINDGVMGGLSRSEFVSAGDTTAVFRGILSLDNYGGFASVRSGTGTYDLGDFEGIELRILGDGRQYQVRLWTDESYDGVSYKYEFQTEKDLWITVRAPFREFAATYRGRIIKDHPPLDPNGIRQVGFLIADSKEGPFRLEIDRIETYPSGPSDQ